MIHLRGGLVGAIETPGAPTAASALLTTGRIDDEAWLAACATEPDADRVGAHLAAAGLIGAAELEIICTAAVFDGAFAMALGPAGGWETGDREPTLVAVPGVEPRALTEEVARRTGVLARAGVAPRELARLRPEASGDGRSGVWLSRRHRELLDRVNGRRTPRDLAFALGRGLFAVMLDLNRLETLELIRWEVRAAPGNRPSTAPRVAPENITGPVPAGGPLPKRRPGGTSPALNHGERGEKGGE
jgi:hypothetical protein